jgi:hypothetical protein
MGSGGWKSRADLRNAGSIGGRMVFDFLDGSTTGALVRAGVTLAGGSGTGMGIGSVVVLRVIGSTGGTMGDDFRAATAPGASEERIAAVLLGMSGSDVGVDDMGGTTGGTVDVVRRAIGGGPLIVTEAAGRGGGSAGDDDFGTGALAPGSAEGIGPSGGWGGIGSGVRAALASVTGAGSGGTVVGRAGGRVRCSTGSRPSESVFPERKTLACGLAMMTRGGAGTEPDAVEILPDGVGTGSGGGGMFGGVASGVVAVVRPRPGTMPVRGGGALGGEAKVALSGAVFERGTPPEITMGTGSGSVFAREPVSEADCVRGEGEGPTRPVGGRVGLCIG